MPTQLIINADDFGATSAINAAVIKTRLRGVLTSASLMVTGQAAAEAISIAKNDPGLAVGLHLALSQVRSALPLHLIPGLVNNNSHFARSPIIAALNYYFNHKLRRELRLEIEAQFELFAKTGLTLSHVDGHQHLHTHPAVLPIVIELAQKYGAAGIRIPHDPLLANLHTNYSRLGSKLFVALGHTYLAGVSRHLLRDSDFVRCDATIGSLMSGAMSDDYVIRMLRNMNCSSIEVFFHPTDLRDNEPGSDPYGPNAGDLRALTSPRLKQFLADNGYELTNYPGLKRKQVEAASEHS